MIDISRFLYDSRVYVAINFAFVHFVLAVVLKRSYLFFFSFLFLHHCHHLARASCMLFWNLNMKLMFFFSFFFMARFCRKSFFANALFSVSQKENIFDKDFTKVLLHVSWQWFSNDATQDCPIRYCTGLKHITIWLIRFATFRDLIERSITVDLSFFDSRFVWKSNHNNSKFYQIVKN